MVFNRFKKVFNACIFLYTTINRWQMRFDSAIGTATAFCQSQWLVNRQREHEIDALSVNNYTIVDFVRRLP